MSLNINNDEAERLARQLAAATVQTVTRAVTVAASKRPIARWTTVTCCSTRPGYRGDPGHVGHRGDPS